MAVILNFGSIFRKSIADPHAARNMMLKLKKIDQTIFFAPTKKISLVHGAILNFSKTLKMSPAHIHMVGNVIVKFE